MRKALSYGLCTILWLFSSCSNINTNNGHSELQELTLELCSIIDRVPGTVGIAFVNANDTITLNNGVHYPMMSVFKLHQALAVANALERRGTTLDSTLHIADTEVDPATWSPMLGQHIGRDFCVSVGQLVKYSLVSSDNNASNLLFKHVVSAAETNRFVKSVAPDTSFNIVFSEAEMKRDHELSYSNHTTPLSAALLIHKLFTDEMVQQATQESIKSFLCVATTGQDRLGSAIQNEQGIVFGHKTGSGYRNSLGALSAHNDIGYFRLPDGRDYSLAVLIRDFEGNEDEASAIIAGISQCVYNFFRK